MLKSKKIKSLVLLTFATVALVGCDDEVRLPTNYEDPIFTVSEDQSVYGNDWEKYYNSVSSSSEIYSKLADKLLLKIADVAHNYSDGNGSKVYAVTPDYFKGSVADQYDKAAALKAENNLSVKAKKSLVDTVKAGTYSKDNLFIEKKYAQYLKENYYYLDVNTADFDAQGKLLTPYLEFDKVFANSDNPVYQTYMEREVMDEMKINYLTAEYIYTKSYASIGNTNARKVQIIALTDRSDEPGAAKNLLNAYINDYVMGEKRDDDFSILSRLWKGITRSTADEVALGRYGNEIVLSSEEEAWLRTNDILPENSIYDDSSSSTLTGKVLADKKKLERGKDDYNFVDSSLESSYTGAYAYDIETGIRKAIDDIATKNLVTEGIYLSSSGISNVPSDLSSRIFSPKLSTNKNTIKEMKEHPGTKKDISLYGKDGYRYLTVADSSTGTNDDIIYYDASSKTYYLTRLLDVVDTSSLAINSSTSVYDTAEKKEQIAREIAYVMSTTGSYKTNSAVYWFSRTKFKYSDEDFLEYMKTTYKDVFKSDNPYTPKEDKDWIHLN